MNARLEGERLALGGDLNYKTVPSLLATSAEQLKAGARIIDFAEVGEVDSAALAMILELLRQAGPDTPLRFVNLPAKLTKLAELYAVRELLEAQAA